jgi:hypothetical protein
VEGLPLLVQTDYHALRYLNTQPHLSRRMARWAELLQQYDITIRYKSGKTNTLADLLSRDIESAQLSVLHMSSDLYEFIYWPLYVPQALEQGLHSVPEDATSWRGS